MKKNGFITSALLYGILALFLILMLGSLAILANRKMSMDNLKEAALEDVGSTSGIGGYYNIWQAGIDYSASGYSDIKAGINGSWVTSSAAPSIVLPVDNHTNIIGIYLNLNENVTSDLPVILYYSETGSFTDDKKIIGKISSNSSSVSFNFTKGNYEYIKLQIGDKADLQYQIKEISVIEGEDEK